MNYNEKRFKLDILNLNNFKLRNQNEILSLRKKKLNNKFLERRINSLKNLNIEKIDNLLIQLKNKKNEEEITLNLLIKIKEMLISNFEFEEEKKEEQNFNFITLINNDFIVICHDILEKFFFPNFIEQLINIFLYSSLMIFNISNEDFNSKQNYFISEDRFLNNYVKIFNVYNENEEIIIKLIRFFGNIIDKNQVNQTIFLKLGIFDLLLNYTKEKMISNELLIILTWFFNLIKLDKLFEININFLKKVQELFISSLLSGRNLSKNELIEISKYSIEGMIYISQNDNEIIMNEFYNYNLISFLLDSEFDNEEVEILILNFFGNLTAYSIQKVEKLINYGLLNKLYNIINSNFNISEIIRQKAFWNINNIFSEKDLFRKIINETNQINLIINVIKKDTCNSISFYNEILIFICNIINYSTVNELLLFICKDEITSIILNILENILNSKKKNFENICIIATTNIFKLLYHSAQNICHESFIYFQKEGIEEICDKVLMTLNEDKDDINELITKWEILKYHFYSNKYL